MPIGGAAKKFNAFDDMPIGGGKKPPVDFDAGLDEEKSLPRGAYNLDALGDDAFGGGDMENKPKKAPPARFANKTAAKPLVEEEKKQKLIIDEPKLNKYSSDASS